MLTVELLQDDLGNVSRMRFIILAMASRRLQPRLSLLRGQGKVEGAAQVGEAKS